MSLTRNQRWWLIITLLYVSAVIIYCWGNITGEGTASIPKILEASVVRGNDKSRIIALPYKIKGEAGEKLDFHIILSYRPGQSGNVWVTPDDCLETITVNDEVVKLTDTQYQRRCSWDEGFSMDLKPYFKEGKNDIFLKISNNTGMTGLAFELTDK